MRSPNRRHDLPLLHKYATASTAKAILQSSTLRWSSPLLFNDPFDVPRDMDPGRVVSREAGSDGPSRQNRRRRPVAA